MCICYKNIDQANIDCRHMYSAAVLCIVVNSIYFDSAAVPHYCIWLLCTNIDQPGQPSARFLTYECDSHELALEIFPTYSLCMPHIYDSYCERGLNK